MRRFELLQARATGLLTAYTRQLLTTRLPTAEVEADHPGELVGIDTFYVGKLKGVGKIWQFTATDVASSYTFCWLSPIHGGREAAQFAELVVTHYQDMGVRLRRILTDNGPEFVARVFGDRVAGLGLAHTRIRPGRPATNGHVERFHGTVLHAITAWPSCRVTWRRFSAGTTIGAPTRASGSAARLQPQSSPTLLTGVMQHDQERFGGAPSVNTSR